MVYRLEEKKAVRRTRKIGNAHTSGRPRHAAHRRLTEPRLFWRQSAVVAHLVESGRLTMNDVREAGQLIRRLSKQQDKAIGTERPRSGQATTMTGLVNHLWQSVMFAGGGWAFSMLVRRNRAAVRYGVWIAASMKFFVLFALMVALGSRINAPSSSVDRAGRSRRAGSFTAGRAVSIPRPVLPRRPLFRPSLR
jgi:hypothetical protein